MTCIQYSNVHGFAHAESTRVMENVYYSRNNSGTVKRHSLHTSFIKRIMQVECWSHKFLLHIFYCAIHDYNE